MILWILVMVVFFIFTIMGFIFLFNNGDEGMGTFTMIMAGLLVASTCYPGYNTRLVTDSITVVKTPYSVVCIYSNECKSIEDINFYNNPDKIACDIQYSKNLYGNQADAKTFRLVNAPMNNVIVDLTITNKLEK